MIALLQTSQKAFLESAGYRQ